MRSRSDWSFPAVSLLGLGVGLVAGVAAGLLAAPMRGAEMRHSLRTRADGALDRGMTLLEEGRRAFRTRTGRALPASPLPSSAPPSPDAPLSASLGEIAQMHSGDDLSALGARP